MSQSLFQTVPLKSRSLLQRIFRQYPQENAVIELNNLLASRPLQSISANDVADIERRHGISLKEEFSLNLEEFYAVVFNSAMSNHTAGPPERANLTHLRNILLLDDAQVLRLHTMIGKEIYQKAFRTAISSGKFSESQKTSLIGLASNLGLSEEDTKKIRERESAEFVKSYVGKIIAKGQYSPADEKNLREVCSDLGVNLSFNPETTEKLKDARLFWELGHLPLPTIEPDITIQKSEVCYIRIPRTQWNELRAVRSGGRSYSQMTPLDTGTLYLTNKRLLFNGREKNHVITLDKIVNVQWNKSGVSIGKVSGKSPLLKFSSRMDVFCVMLQRAIRER